MQRVIQVVAHSQVRQVPLHGALASGRLLAIQLPTMLHRGEPDRKGKSSRSLPDCRLLVSLVFICCMPKEGWQGLGLFFGNEGRFTTLLNLIKIHIYNGRVLKCAVGSIASEITLFKTKVQLQNQILYVWYSSKPRFHLCLSKFFHGTELHSKRDKSRIRNGGTSVHPKFR